MELVYAKDSEINLEVKMTDDVKIAFSNRESECLAAAMKLLEESMSTMPIGGFSGSATDPRVAGRALLVEIVNEKYHECAGIPKKDKSVIGPINR